MTQSALEAAFSLAWRIYAPDCERPLEQYRFAAIHVGLGLGLRERLAAAGLQDWRFDFAFPWATPPLAIECDGGQWSPHGGRHNTDGDRDKLNHAAALGWRTMRFSGAMLERDPERCARIVKSGIYGDLGQEHR